MKTLLKEILFGVGVVTAVSFATLFLCRRKDTDDNQAGVRIGDSEEPSCDCSSCKTGNLQNISKGCKQAESFTPEGQILCTIDGGEVVELRRLDEPSLAICSDCHDLLNEKGECDYCSSLSPCCGTAFDKDYRICPSCKEHV